MIHVSLSLSVLFVFMFLLCALEPLSLLCQHLVRRFTSWAPCHSCLFVYLVCVYVCVCVCCNNISLGDSHPGRHAGHITLGDPRRLDFSGDFILIVYIFSFLINTYFHFRYPSFLLQHIRPFHFNLIQNSSETYDF